ncbi:MAG: hypothetical protein PHI35_01175 [Victivallaceae bacterium]|nr:hypothetical protein [Victivallaceae bacterium]
MKISTFTAVVAALLAGVSLFADFNALLLPGSSLWESGAEEIFAAAPKGCFTWGDAQHKTLEYKAFNRPPLKIGIVVPMEITVRLNDEKKVKSATVRFYNRGDSGATDRDEFKDVLKQVTSLVESMSGNAPSRRSSVVLRNEKVNTRAWDCVDRKLTLRWMQQGFVDLEIERPGTEGIKNSIKADVSQDELTAKIQTDPDGTVYFLVPMVDQGNKGYCFASTIERVMRHYGAEIDQHVIAEMAKTDSSKGTNLYTALDAMRSAQRKLNVKLTKLYLNDDFSSNSNFERLLRTYNQIAKKEDKPQIKIKNFTKRGSFNAQKLFASLDKKTFTAARARDKVGMEKFKNDISEYISRGIPLCWGVLILPDPTKPNSPFGGHIRLINGINANTDKIVYTDSWGKGHDKKFMPLDEAWGMTTFLFVIQPSKNK